MGIRQFVTNAYKTIRRSDEAGLFGFSHDGNRDIKEVYGYPTEGQRSFSYYYEYYRFNGMANRIVSMIPRSCWRDGAVISDSHDSDTVLLEDEMKELKRAGMFRELEKADILNRIGNYSVMYVGVPDGEDPSQPVSNTPKSASLAKDVYFAAYNFDSITITDYDEDPTSARYGLPVMYTLNPSSTNTDSKTADNRQSIKAHWTRVVHLAEGALDNGITGTPALEPGITRCIDWDKTIGGGAEAFFRNAAQKLTLDIDKEAKATKDDMDALNDGSKKWLNGWKSFIGLKGAKIRALEVPNADPRESTETIIQGLSGTYGIPVRILTGEGAGQLAGNEDKASYNQLINDRQDQLCAEWLLDTLTPLERAGMLTMPEDFVVQWPLPEAMDEKTMSEVRLNEARAANALADAGSKLSLGGEEFIGALLETFTTLDGSAFEGLIGGIADGDGPEE